MSKLVTGLAIGGVVAVIAIAAVGSYFSAASYGNRMERTLEAKQENNENVLSSGYQQLQGVGGVTKMAKDDTVEIFRAAVQGRYGANGSQQVFLAVKEMNPQIDPQLYRKVQQVVESTQKEFQNAQTEMVDVKRSYQTALGSPWQGFWLGVAGYPKIDLSKFTIVSSQGASDAFRTKKQQAPNFGR